MGRDVIPDFTKIRPTTEESTAGLSRRRTAERKTSEEVDRQHHWLYWADTVPRCRRSQDTQ